MPHVLLVSLAAFSGIVLAESRQATQFMNELEVFQAQRMVIGFFVGIVAQGIVLAHSKKKRGGMLIVAAILFSGLVSALAGGAILAILSRNLILELLVEMLAGVSGGFAAIKVLDTWQAKVTGLRFMEEETSNDPRVP